MPSLFATWSCGGAPAIGISAAYGVALAARHAGGGDWKADIKQAIRELAASRPTAVNLFWALQRMERVFHDCHSLAEACERLAAEAVAIHEEDLAANLAMADHALAAMQPEQPLSVLTHCNTGPRHRRLWYGPGRDPPPA